MSAWHRGGEGVTCVYSWIRLGSRYRERGLVNLANTFRWAISCLDRDTRVSNILELPHEVTSTRRNTE